MSLFADLKVYLRFHNNCGKSINLSKKHQTAQLRSRGGGFWPVGMVISRDPMLTDMLYQVSETFSLSVCLSVCLSVSVCLSLRETCIQSCGNVEHFLHLFYKTHRRHQ